jgi:hypothetical protein
MFITFKYFGLIWNLTLWFIEKELLEMESRNDGHISIRIQNQQLFIWVKETDIQNWRLADSGLILDWFDVAVIEIDVAIGVIDEDT